MTFVAAVEREDFHIWQVGHIAEGMDIFTGVQAGNVPDENGRYPEGSIFAKVEDRFLSVYEAAKEREKELANTVKGSCEFFNNLTHPICLQSPLACYT